MGMFDDLFSDDKETNKTDGNTTKKKKTQPTPKSGNKGVVSAGVTCNFKDKNNDCLLSLPKKKKCSEDDCIFQKQQNHNLL